MVLPILPILSILTVRDSSLCAFLMYAFWWHKPLLPEHPIILHDDKLAPLAAFMYSSSQMSGYVNPRRIKSKTIVKTFLAHLHLYWKTPEFDNICLRDHRPPGCEWGLPMCSWLMESLSLPEALDRTLTGGLWSRRQMFSNSGVFQYR